MSRKTTVTVVEDITEIREVLQEGIADTDDLECVATYDMAETALEGLLKNPSDVVVMDIGLPGMSGVECMLRVKLKHPQVDFLMFTVFDNSEHVFGALKAGAGGYVLKREGPEGVVLAVRELIDGGAPMSREIAKKVLHSFHHYGPSNPLVEKLTARELEILNLLSQGLLYKEVAQQLIPQIAEGTVKQHIHRIYRKLQVNNRTEAINLYMKDRP